MATPPDPRPAEDNGSPSAGKLPIGEHERKQRLVRPVPSPEDELVATLRELIAGATQGPRHTRPWNDEDRDEALTLAFLELRKAKRDYGTQATDKQFLGVLVNAMISELLQQQRPHRSELLVPDPPGIAHDDVLQVVSDPFLSYMQIVAGEILDLAAVWPRPAEAAAFLTAVCRESERRSTESLLGRRIARLADTLRDRFATVNAGGVRVQRSRFRSALGAADPAYGAALSVMLERNRKRSQRYGEIWACGVQLAAGCATRSRRIAVPADEEWDRECLRRIVLVAVQMASPRQRDRAALTFRNRRNWSARGLRLLEEAVPALRELPLVEDRRRSAQSILDRLERVADWQSRLERLR